MAKESKKKRAAGGRKAYLDRLKSAHAAGKKTIKIGKHRISVTAQLAKHGGGGKSVKSVRKAARKAEAKVEVKQRRKSSKRGRIAHKPEHYKTAGRTVSAAPRKKKRKSGKRKTAAKRKTSRKTGHKSHALTRTTRTVVVKVPGKTRKVYLTAADKRRGRGHRRSRRNGGYAMENPLSTTEVIAGGLTMLFGLAVADISDRYWATHALTAGTTNAAGATTYTDTPAVTSTTGMATVGSGLYPGMKNGAAVIAPMNLTRWLSGGTLAAVPFIAAAFTKTPTLRSALQLFGFGVIARIGGKALVDLFAGLLGSTSLGQQLYVNELAATGQYQAAMGNPVTVSLPGITDSTQITAAGTAVATGLAKAPQPSDCAACAAGRPCNCAKCRAASATPSPQQQANALQAQTTDTTLAAPHDRQAPRPTPRTPQSRPNPFAYGSQFTGDTRH